MAFNKSVAFWVLSAIFTLCLIQSSYGKSEIHKHAFNSKDCTKYSAINLAAFQCTPDDGDMTGECIPAEWECDSIIDCDNGRDELTENCREKHIKNCVSDFEGKISKDGSLLKHFLCADGMCILGCQRCDGQSQCMDSSDEANCPESFEAPPCN